jgi:hypothetical protein
MDPRRLSLAASSTKLTGELKRAITPRHARGEWFLKGPIPGNWLSQATALGCRALRVALAIWCEAGMRGRRTVQLSAEMQRRFSICARTCKLGVSALRSAGLVSVKHKPGRRPEITIEEYRS